MGHGQQRRDRWSATHPGRFRPPLVVLVLALALSSGVTTESAAARRVSTSAGWVFEEISDNPLTSPDVDRYDYSFHRRWPEEPRAEAITSWDQVSLPSEAPQNATLSIPVDVRVRILPDADTTLAGYYQNDAIPIVGGSWDGRTYVGAGARCEVAIGGQPLGCTPPEGEYAVSSGTWEVRFPLIQEEGERFTFGVSALNCSECYVEYVYVAKEIPVDPGERCFGAAATIHDWDGDGRLIGTLGDDVIIGTPGDDVAKGNGGNDRICTRGGNDEIRLKEGAGLVSGGAGNRDAVFLDFDEPALVTLRRHEGDVVTLGGTQTFAGDIERLVGSRRGDTVRVRGQVNAGFRLDGGGGLGDAVSFSGQDQPVETRPGERSGALVALASFLPDGLEVTRFDILRGGDGADSFLASLTETYGGRGDDLMLLGEGQEGFGGLGADGIVLRHPGPMSANGGPGADLLAFVDAGWPSGTVVSLLEGIVYERTGLSGEVTELVGIEDVEGTSSADTLFGDDGRNQLFGEGGNDSLGGLGGRDRLEGGRGADDLHGGAGRDTADGGPGLDSCRAAESVVRCE